jgi:hypothetical protein
LPHQRFCGEIGNETIIHIDGTSEHEREYLLFTSRNTPRKYETGKPV